MTMRDAQSRLAQDVRDRHELPQLHRSGPAARAQPVERQRTHPSSRRKRRAAAVRARHPFDRDDGRRRGAARACERDPAGAEPRGIAIPQAEAAGPGAARRAGRSCARRVAGRAGRVSRRAPGRRAGDHHRHDEPALRRAGRGGARPDDRQAAARRAARHAAPAHAARVGRAARHRRRSGAAAAACAGRRAERDARDRPERARREGHRLGSRMLEQQPAGLHRGRARGSA